MKSIRTEIVIQAAAAPVWAVLTDFASHAAWDPFLTGIQGRPVVGERLAVRFNTGETVRPIVTEARDGRVLEWLGKLSGGWLFAARHRFELVEEGQATRLVHSETFTGLLVPFLAGTLARAERGFQALNRALEERVEAGQHGAQARHHA